MTSSAETSPAVTAAAIRRAGHLWSSSICRGTILGAVHVSSVNLARAPSRLKVGRRLTQTGIDKRPTDEPVEIGRLGLAGDTIWSKKHHGGPDQAVYVYGEDDYAWWAAELGRPLAPGTFGENLTVSRARHQPSGRRRPPAHPRRVVLEVTCGRTPCGTLTAHMGIRAFSRRFRESGRLGLYCRVIAGGTVRRGDAVRYEPTASPLMPILEFEEMFCHGRSLARADRARPGRPDLRARPSRPRGSARRARPLSLSARLRQ